MNAHRRVLMGGLAAAIAYCWALVPSAAANAPASPATPIKHVVFIMQENRSFDHYFGTYPRANGIPAGTCVPLDPSDLGRGCVIPFHDPDDLNAGGPHSAAAAQADIDDGITTAKQDGYILSQTAAADGPECRKHPDNPKCVGSRRGVLTHDVVGYHDAEEIPNYWAYAKHFVLQDRLFAGVRSWSLPTHLDLVSEWVAACTNDNDASTCVTAPDLPFPSSKKTQYPWVSLFQLLDLHGVTWKYYLGIGTEPDCVDGEMTCAPQIQTAGVEFDMEPRAFFPVCQATGVGLSATP